MKTLFALAHPDDEIACLQSVRNRLGENPAGTTVLWVSNGDTITGRPVTQDLEDAVATLKDWGLQDSQAIRLGVSEKENYRALSEGNGEHFYRISRQLLGVLLRVRQDEVLVPGLQGGNIMHDLLNFLMSYTMRECRSRGCEAALLEFPCYEFMEGYPHFRFGRFGSYDAAVPEGGRGIKLTDNDLRKKKGYLRHYTADADLFRMIEEETPRHIWNEEHLRPVPPERDYTILPSDPLVYEVHLKAVQARGRLITHPVGFAHFSRMVSMLQRRER
ncbi:MAG: hypothetical protein V1735_00500 [Nanoarchaeota archaeon]